MKRRRSVLSRKTSEDELQRQVVRALEWRHRDLKFFHVGNGGKRGLTEAKRFKGLGVKAGVADLIFCLPGGQFAAIELKTEKGTLSKDQKEFRDDILALGGKWALCRSVEGVLDVVSNWKKGGGADGRIEMTGSTTSDMAEA